MLPSVAKITAFSKSAAPRLSVEIHDIPFKALFDTGAARSLLHIDIFNQIALEHQLSCSESDVELFDVHNKKLFTLGIVSLPMVYGANILDQEFIVTNGISEACILGLDAADKHEFIFDGRSKTIFLARDGPGSHQEIKQEGLLPKSQEPTVKMAMTLVKRVLIAPRSSQVVEATFKENGDNMDTNSLFLFSQSMDLPEGIFIDNFINARKDNGKYQIVVENKSNRAHALPRDSSLGEVEFSCQLIGKVSSGQESASPANPPDKECVPEPDVDPQYKKPLASLLNEFTDLFATKDSGLGSTSLITHFIDTEGKGPIRLRPYRTGQGQKEELEKQIKEMLQANVIRHSTSPWAAPVILVVKKTGEMRFCIDYRKLNNLTKKDSYPLPRIDSTLDRLYGKKFFTTLDLASGYWQIELEESSKEKTAFIVENISTNSLECLLDCVMRRLPSND
ncbi:uncharacterized protein LOC130695606 [Daphnia carinata]|uniref:uncharacterized protein LOC130695606 n=1 Tax=Daphnia carinata TaxID=120202 RepID=UPI00257BEA59|nr:uncharacterized protein LOC130695606 [Daphnia carinata]